MAIDKIKRSFIWLRKVLEITEKTTLPGQILGEVRPTIDTFGWDRLNQTTTRVTSGAAASGLVQSAVTPDDVLRLVVAASVQNSDAVQAFTMWIEHNDAAVGLSTSLMRPVDIPISATQIRVGLPRMIVLRPGDTLRGRSSPDPGVGLVLALNVYSVDLPIGEYVPPT